MSSNQNKKQDWFHKGPWTKETPLTALSAGLPLFYVSGTAPASFHG
jgi:hypothetical protein